MLKRCYWIIALFASLIFSSASIAKVSEEEAKRLHKDLTPYGAERAGNKAGTIPAWVGGITKDYIPAAYERKGQHHPDPYADDKKLYTITAQNMAQYDALLTEGLKALLKTYPETFFIPVYPSRRSASAPQWVYDNIYKNALKAELVNNGNGIDQAYGGIPFPIPTGFNGKVDPLMPLWNHLTRWRGVYVVRRSSEAVVQQNKAFALINGQQEVDFVYYHPDGNFETLDNRLLYYLSYIKQPPRLAGGAVLVHDTLDRIKDERAAWGYNAGQRRVRRAPNLGYDTPVPSSDGLVTADDVDIFNGAPDRYNWHFLGKKEMLIPYNSYELDSPKYKYEQILDAGHVNPKYTRFELHRVWVIEARLKKDIRHIYSKRTFYLDEDSWNIAVADQYDSRGDIWRVSLSYLKNYYEVPCLWTALDVYHDLHAKRYYAAFLDNEEESSLDFRDDPPPARYFKAAELRRRGTR